MTEVKPLEPSPSNISTTLADLQVEWSFDNTLACRLLGRKRAEIIWRAYFQSKLQTFGRLSTFPILCVIMTLCLVEVIVSPPLMILISVLIALAIFSAMSFTADVTIALELLDSTFCIAFFVQLASLVCFSLTIGSDYRSSISVSYVATFFGSWFVDSFNSHTRTLIRAVLSFFCTLYYASLLMLMVINRIPRQNDVVIDLGTLGGIASSPVTYSLLQTSVSGFFALTLMFANETFHIYRHRSSKRLRMLSLPKVGKDASGFVPFPWYGGSSSSTIGSDGARGRRPEDAIEGV